MEVTPLFVSKQFIVKGGVVVTATAETDSGAVQVKFPNNQELWTSYQNLVPLYPLAA